VLLAGCCPYYSKTDQIKSIAVALIKSAQHLVKTGSAFADSNLQKARILSCQRCEHFSDNSCYLCGCKIAQKIVPAGSSCPVGYW
jgi:hypothetical protein